jgi:hypothetical protein
MIDDTSESDEKGSRKAPDQSFAERNTVSNDLHDDIANGSSNADIISFRITGAQSVQRLYPLLLEKYRHSHSNIAVLREDQIIEALSLEDKCSKYGILLSQHSLLVSINRNDSASLALASDQTVQPVTFVWETFCEQAWRTSHEHAVVLNRLHNSNILESKVNLAFIQLKASEIASSASSSCKYLETYVALKPSELTDWCKDRWARDRDECVRLESNDWWVLKAGSGNGGKDVWILTPETYQNIIAEVSTYRDEEYVIQK